MHWLIIILFIIGIVLLQFKVFGKTLSKLNVYRKSFNSDDEIWQINHLGDAAQIIPESLNNLYGQIKEKEKEIEEINAEITKTNKRLSKRKQKLAEAQLEFSDFMMDDHLLDLISKDEARMNELSESMNLAKGALDGLKSEFESKNNCRNEIQKRYVDSINQYLEKNSNRVTDFHLIKNIVDRNCDAAEDEIHTQIPVPLYLGLVGTMLGIIVGVGFLIFTGALDSLLSTSSSNSSATEGVEALLGGVGVAMISSVIGIILTTVGSWETKDCVSYVEKKKNDFLSWMQAELLPTLTNDAASALEKLSENLSDFNEEFALHTNELSATLGTVQDTTDSQAKLLNEINNLNISKIAKANIEVYDKLKTCTDEIGKVGDYVGNINLYLNAIRELAQKLDDANERTKMIEEIARYFRDERASLDTMRGIVSHNIGLTETYFTETSEKLKESVSRQYDSLIKQSAESMEKYERVMDEQQRTLEKKSAQLSGIVEELKSMSSIKTLMSNIEKATREQSHKLSELSENISKLVNMKTGGELQRSNTNWFRYAMVAIGGVTALSMVIIVLFLIFEGIPY